MGACREAYTVQLALPGTYTLSLQVRDGFGTLSAPVNFTWQPPQKRWEVSAPLLLPSTPPHLSHAHVLDRSSQRTPPIAEPLRPALLEQKARTGRRGEELVFGRTPSEPFTPTWIRKRALTAWEAANEKRAQLTLKRQPLVPIGLHEARHSYASWMVDAGFPLERIGDYVGHSSAFMVDRYRHLLEGHEQEAADAFTAYLARKTGAHAGAHRAAVGAEPAPLSGIGLVRM